MPKPLMPKISIVTPSFNQAEFLEDAITSILSQNYPNLEYIIIDGGSTDGSIDIIKKYAHRIAYWVSEPDKGHGDALNKGFKHATGEIMAWLNSDDLYFPWTLNAIADIFNDLPRLEWLTSNIKIMLTRKGLPYKSGLFYSFGRKAFFEGLYLLDRGAIPQESTFWRRTLWEHSGGRVSEGLTIVPDFELWAKFWQYSNLYTVPVPLGAIRAYKQQTTSANFNTCCREAVHIWHKYKGKEPPLFYRYIRDFLMRFLLVKSICGKNYTLFFDLKNNRWYFFPLLERCKRKFFRKSA